MQFSDRGDANRFRDQGQLIIHSNRISDAAQYGIEVTSGPRDADSNSPHPGPTRNLSEPNTSRLARGPVLYNNLIVAAGSAAIRFAGDVGGAPLGAVPFGRIFNNTLYGSGGDFGTGPFGSTDTGVLVENNASPTILNNIIANFTVPVSIDGSSASTVIADNMYRANNLDPYLNPGLLGAKDIDLDSPLETNKSLFVDVTTRNFYLAAGSRAIDSSFGALQDRPEMRRVLEPIFAPNQYLASPILAPLRDLTGQVRVDDPDVEPLAGIGQDPRKDRGAIDRSDFTGPEVELVTPPDNDSAGLDLDPVATSVRLQSGPLTEITLRLKDVAALGGNIQGSGIDDSTIGAADVAVNRDGTTLQQGVDYRFDYDATNNLIVLTPLAGVWVPGAYVVSLNNEGISDIAGNPLRANQPDASTRFTIALGQGIDFGDAPDPPFATLLDNNGPRHTIEPGFFLGTGISAETDGRPSISATGDLGDNGVVFSGLLRKSFPVTMTVTSSGIGFVDGWIDYNQNDSWEPGEKILDSAAVMAGANTFEVVIPADAELGETYARFRLSRNGNLTTTGPADNGEVEDYRLIISDPGIDFGDAPDPTYPTLTSSNGAAHMIVPGFSLGATNRPEDDGNPTPAANGDVNDDGITFTGMITAGSATDVVVNASAAGFVDAWVDFNRNGNWDDPGEQIFSSQAVVAGDNTLAMLAPSDAEPGTSFARFRFSSTGGLTPTGLAADGEVEDYSVIISPAIEPDTFDFGDAPQPPFATTLAADGARHVIVDGFYLGNSVDPELDGIPSALADGDTGDDGVTFGDLLAGRTVSISVIASADGLLDAWIDFNRNGDWSDAGEHIYISQALVVGPNQLLLDVPEDIVAGATFARFRFSSEGGLTPTGQALDGEVEDYRVALVQPTQSWHNFDNPVDVNGMDGVQPLDALAVINELNDPQFSDPITGELDPNPTPPPFLDVTNDGFVSPLDALLVINELPTSSNSAPMSLVVMGDRPELASLPLESDGPQPETAVDVRVVTQDLALRSLGNTPSFGESLQTWQQPREDDAESVDEIFARW